MAGTYKIVESLPEEQWMQFVLAHPSGNIFHSHYMYHIFENAKKHKPKFLAAADVNSGGVTAILFATQVDVMGNFSARFSSRGIIYGGILCLNDHSSQEAIFPLVDAYDRSVKHRVLLTEIRNLSATEGYRKNLEELGYEYRPYLNYLIHFDIDSESLFRSFSQSCRRNIRKAETLGIDIREIDDPRNLPAFYQLIQKTYSRKRVAIADMSLFESAFNLLYQKNMVKFFIAYLGMQPVACRSIFLFKDQIYDWYAGSDPQYNKTCANELMVWHLLKLGSHLGFKIFDFGGAGYPDEEYGVRDFKARFGGELVNYGRYMKIYSAFRYRISRWGYRAYQRFL